MKQLILIIVLNLIFSVCIKAQKFECPCKNENNLQQNEIVLPTGKTSAPIITSGPADISIGLMQDSIRYYTDQIQKGISTIYSLKKTAFNKCKELAGKKTICLSEMDSINETFKIKASKIAAKVLEDTVYLTRYYQKYLTQKRSLAFLISNDARKNHRIKKLSRHGLVFVDSTGHLAYHCLIQGLKFSCVLCDKCLTDSCNSRIIDPAVQTKLCIPLCAPDKDCKEYRYNKETCQCECLERDCPPTLDCKYPYWDTIKQECNCKEPAIVCIPATAKRMDLVADSITSGLGPENCILSFNTDGINALFTIGVGLSTDCATYFKRMNYIPGEYELPSDYKKTIDMIFSQIKKYIGSDYLIRIKVVGTADSMFCCTKKYEGVDNMVELYYLVSGSNNCTAINNTNLEHGITPIDNPLLGFLRAYAFESLITKNFPRCPYVTYYSRSYGANGGGYYRRTELYIWVSNFNEKIFNRVIDSEKDDYLKAFKKCTDCHLYELLNICDQK